MIEDISSSLLHAYQFISLREEGALGRGEALVGEGAAFESTIQLYI